MTDHHTRLYWDIVVTGTGAAQTGNYVMGEPWLALAPGQTAKVVHIGRWLVAPSGGNAGTIDPTYPGPVSPANQQYRHGAMLNPQGGGTLHPVADPVSGVTDLLRPRRLGYDDRVGVFSDPANNGASVPFFDSALFLPINDPGHPGLPMTPGDILVATVSNGPACNNCAHPNAWTDIWAFHNGDACTVSQPNGASCSTSPTQWAAALSVLDVSPPSGAFRKPCCMPSPAARLAWPHRTLNQIDWTQLPRLAWPSPPTNCPSPHPSFGCFPTAAMVAPMFSGMWLDHVSGETAEERVNPSMHIPGYGQYTKRIIATAACLAALNPDALGAGMVAATPPLNADFVQMVHGLLQAGIDVAGLLQDPTHSFEGGGGKVGGRKFLAAFAAKMFGANAYPGMDGFFGSPPPNGPPRWTVWRLQGGIMSPFERFQEDRQHYRARDPLQHLAPNSRLDWDWTGSPWLWCSERGDRLYQITLPSTWPPAAAGPAGSERKRFNSSPPYASLTIALRLLQMEPLWENTGLSAIVAPLPNEPLHPMFGYMDRWMVPASGVAATAYAPAGTMDHRQAQEWNLSNPYKVNPTLAMTLWNGYRAQPVTNPHVALVPANFTFDDAVTGCAQFRAPTMVCQFPPRTGKPILIEVYASESYSALNTTWGAVLMTSVPGPGMPVTIGNNTVTVYLDPGALIWQFTAVNQYGFLGSPLTLPSVTVGTQFAVQALFGDVGNTLCVAASNAVILTVLP